MKAKTKQTAKEILTVTIAASVTTAIRSVAKDDATAFVAATKSEKSLLTLADKLKEAHGKDNRDAVSAALKPLFIAAYKAAGKRDESYALQQKSRVVSLAFPGGKKATDKERENAAKQLTAGIAKGYNVNDLIQLANGGAVIKKVGSEEKIVSLRSAPAHNAKKPADAYKASIEAALVAYCKNAKGDFIQSLNWFVDIACKLEIKGAKDWSEANPSK